VHSRAQAWYGRRTWHWRDWPAELLLADKRRVGARISVVIPAQFVREGAQVRPVAHPVPVQERPPVAGLAGRPARRDPASRDPASRDGAWR